MEQLELDFREWKQVPGYEGIYDLRDDGLLYSYPRNKTKGGYRYGAFDKDGYLNYTINNKKVRVNRLVWKTFVGPIPEGYDIHHKNHIKTDNRLENLELIKKYEHCKLHKEKPILQFTKDGEFVAEYPSELEASRQTGINNSNISLCCKGIYKTAGGSIWKYKEVA